MVQPSSSENVQMESLPVVTAGLRSPVVRVTTRESMVEPIRDRDVVVGAREGEAPIRRIAPGTNLIVVKDLLGGLDTATIAGQHYICEKVLSVFRSELSMTEGRLSDLQRRAVTLSLDKLTHEAKRIAPDVASFVSRAEAIVASLSAT